MTTDKTYVTQLSAEDLSEIAQVANLNVKLPLRIDRNGDSATIYIEEQKLKDMLWCFVSQIIPAPGVRVDRADAMNVPFDLG